MAVLNLERPVRSSASVAWELMKNNVLLAVVTIAVIVMLNLFSALPMIGLLFSILSAVVMIDVQIYTAKQSVRFESAEELAGHFKTVDFKALLWENRKAAFGGWLGMVLFSVVMMIVIALLMYLFGIMGFLSEVMQSSEHAEAIKEIPGGFVPFLLFGSLILTLPSYVYPLVYGRMLHADSLSEAFNAMMGIFSPETWKRTFSSEYFMLMLGLMAMGLGVAIVMAICFATFILIPVALAILYWMQLWMALVLTHVVAVADVAPDQRNGD